jgi:hypothetical protein
VNIDKLPQLFAHAPLRLTDPVKIVKFAAAIPRFSAAAPLNQRRGIKRRPMGESKVSYILGRAATHRQLLVPCFISLQALALHSSFKYFL